MKQPAALRDAAGCFIPELFIEEIGIGQRMA